MKIIICGTMDTNWSRMIEGEGHQLHGYFPSSLDAIRPRSRTILERQRCPIHTHRFSEADIDNALAHQVDAMITIGYPYIVPVDKNLKGMNVHPSYLPAGRGISPIPDILLKHPEWGGVSVHKLTQKLDAGDILLQEQFTLSEFDDQSTLLMRMYYRSAELVNSILKDLDYYWTNAHPQPPVAPWKSQPSIGTIDPTLGVADNIRIWRAFGTATRIEMHGEDKWLSRLSGWLEHHNFSAGEILDDQSPFITMAVVDGFLVGVTSTDDC